jgi:hypothetical protein
VADRLALTKTDAVLKWIAAGQLAAVNVSAGEGRLTWRIPELLKADLGETVFAPEGEKDVDNLARFGLQATCNPGGAGNWKVLDKLAVKAGLGGRHVVILPDNDPKGEEHALDVAKQLEGVAASIKILRLPGLPPKGDVSDWLAAGGTTSELLRLARETVSSGDQDRSPDPKPAARDGYVIILEHYRARYRPAFRRGTSLYSSALGREVRMGEATAGAGKALIDELAVASNAPHNPDGSVKYNGLPQLFNTWSRSAWVDLLDSLSDEESVEKADGEAAEVFRQLVRQALLTPLRLGVPIQKGPYKGKTRPETRALVDWCLAFAKPGMWKAVRSYRVWCRLDVRPDGEAVLRVALRHELLGQIGADKRLIDLGPKRFARQAALYGVGKAGYGGTGRDEPAEHPPRPGGGAGRALGGRHLAPGRGRGPRRRPEDGRAGGGPGRRPYHGAEVAGRAG